MTTSFDTSFSASFAAIPFATAVPPFADVDRYLSGQPVGTVPPANLADLLADASASIRRYCRWHIAPAITEAAVLDGSGSTSQRLPTLHLLDVLTVTENGTPLDVATLEWSADGYMRKHRYGLWTDRLRGVVVSYRHGFDLAAVGELGALVCTLVARTVTAPSGFVTGESVGSTSVSYAPQQSNERSGSMTLLGYEQQVLDSYRLPGRRSG